PPVTSTARSYKSGWARWAGAGGCTRAGARTRRRRRGTHTALGEGVCARVAELKEEERRVEDALSTARAAVEEGIVPGGGVALINAIPVLDKVQTCNDDERFGVQILKRALEEPMRILARNAGEDGAVIIDTVRRNQQASGDTTYGQH